MKQYKWLTLFLLLFTTPVHAHFGWHHGGVGDTATGTMTTTATMQLITDPGDNCRAPCFAVMWRALSDPMTGDWVQGGITYDPFKNNQRYLWWESCGTKMPNKWKGCGVHFIKYIPNIPVIVTLTKTPGKKEVRVLYSWQGGSASQAIKTATWINGGGVSPAYFEIYTSSISYAWPAVMHPLPIKAHFWNLSFTAADAAAKLKPMLPYLNVTGTRNDFMVEGVMP